MRIQDLGSVPPEAEIVSLLNVEYAMVKLEEGATMYLTEHGIPWSEQLKPRNWWHNRWERLTGTSQVSKVATNGCAKPGCRNMALDIVVKFNRFGTTDYIDGNATLDPSIEWEFNSPFEEFALVFELRRLIDTHSLPLRTQTPLAIYVPEYTVDPWRSGRRHSMFERLSKSSQVDLDIRRDYLTIYRWVEGLDALEAFQQLGRSDTDLAQLTAHMNDRLREVGFLVGDSKPQHVIVRLNGDHDLARAPSGEVDYTLIDFELLRRTRESRTALSHRTRGEYHLRQARRFSESPSKAALPPHLQALNLFGADYVYGQVPSTDGRLWVVGHDPALFDFFQPERWRTTPRRKLSPAGQIYHTVTKDNIHLVWRVSRVGETPDVEPDDEESLEVIEYGYNSPFEEVAMALELSRRGVPTIYPRAIYMTGPENEICQYMADDRRYETHRNVRGPDGEPVLQRHRAYIGIWGYWNGPDEAIASDDSNRYRPCNLLQAYRSKAFSVEDYRQLLHRSRDLLRQAGVEDLNPKAHHLLVSFDRQNHLLRDPDGFPEVRLCNFELLRWIA